MSLNHADVPYRSPWSSVLLVDGFGGGIFQKVKSFTLLNPPTLFLLEPNIRVNMTDLGKHIKSRFICISAYL